MIRLGTPPAPAMAIEVTDSAVGGAVPIESLMAVARRDNPMRAVLVVSRVLGKHLSVAPTTAVAAGMALGEVVAAALGGGGPQPAAAVLTGALATATPPPLLVASSSGPDAIVVGYAETATALGHLVRRALGPGPMLHTTRALAPAGALLGFGEPHSHAVDHLLFHDDAGVLAADVPIVLVDDELTTGRTIMNTIEAIEARWHRTRYLVATLLDWRPASARDELAAFALRAGVTVDVVSLAAGSATVTDGDGAGAARPEPAPATVDRPVDELTVALGARPTARRGWTPEEQVAVETGAQAAAAQLDEHRSGDRVLVLGTEELMFTPMLVAAHLAGDVHFRSTTRSPVLTAEVPGYPIVDGVTFKAGGPRFLYNLGLDEVDDVFLCVEDAAADCASGLVAALAARHGNLHLVELRP